MGWRKLNRKCQVSNVFSFFFRAPKSLTAINTCLDEMEGLEGRDIAFVSDWITKKGLQKWECLNINDFYRLYINDVDFLYNGVKLRLCPAFVSAEVFRIAIKQQ